jgi:hypothetical protein
MNYNGCGRNRSGSNLRQYAEIYLERLKRAINDVSLDTDASIQDHLKQMFETCVEVYLHASYMPSLRGT